MRVRVHLSSVRRVAWRGVARGVDEFGAGATLAAIEALIRKVSRKLAEIGADV